MAFSSVFTKASRFISPSPQRTTSLHDLPTRTELEQQSESGSMSPTKQRTERWLQGHSPRRHDSGLDLRKVREGRIGGKNGPNQRKKRASFWNLALWFGGSSKSQSDEREEEDLEGDTMIDDAESAAAPGYDNDLTLVVDNYDEGIKDGGSVRPPQNHGVGYFDYKNPCIQEWTEEERWLFTRLRNRGYEPLLHDTWIIDYPQFPDPLFTHNEEQVYINNIHSSTGRACRSLTDLIMASSRVRDQILSGAVTEKPLFHAINKYYKWSIADANVHHKDFIPVIAIATAKGQESVESVVGRVTDQLHSLSRQYRDKWRRRRRLLPGGSSSKSKGRSEEEEEEEFTHELPTLTGFVIKYSVVAIVTCDSRVPGSPIRTLGTFDFKVVGQDVWHALAVAIAMVRGRNYLMRLDAEGELGPEVVDYSSDPDA